ncbi:methylmalonyl Co-A mutase-associated GTPase MeaB [Sphaerisporangium rufum]|uniref:methylmalonyl Co-A mutase-associated GTPase MeaB n=1 Tax=Sphaerisporangium rufum TaxID=1381558 RepID=UPI00194FE15C|nr:methylmalonyl Co-A mutase-associated GTPase MeaB [Sphaerisporangium rufum]
MPALEEYAEGVRAGSPRWVARAITLVESTRPDHQELAQRLLVELTPLAGKARRVGVTGVPGVGKSTFIDALGVRLTGEGHRVAVLAVDPSSTRTGGSILGDKTRMARLSADPAAYIRPSPTSGTLGGVAKATREAMVVVEAAGFDVVLVETVGVGQSETAVAEMVDTFLLLSLARTGDQLQGMKKGVLELADVIAVNKADGPHEADARKAARELAGALRLLGPGAGGWTPPVVTCSGQEGTGLAELWGHVVRHHDTLAATGELAARRRRQQVGWTRALVRDRLLARLAADPQVAEVAAAAEREVLEGTLTPALAADRVLAAFARVTAGPSRAAGS